MTIPKHIDIFNKVVAKALLVLYDNFPRPIDLDPMSIGMDIVFAEGLEADSEEMKILVGTPEATLDFLVDEGFVRFKPENRYMGGGLKFPDSVLTARGLALLNGIPTSVDEAKDRRTYIERFRSAAATGLKTAIPEAIGSLVGGFLSAG